MEEDLGITFWSPQAYTQAMRASVHAHAYSCTYRIQRHMKTEKGNLFLSYAHTRPGYLITGF